MLLSTSNQVDLLAHDFRIFEMGEESSVFFFLLLAPLLDEVAEESGGGGFGEDGGDEGDEVVLTKELVLLWRWRRGGWKGG